MKFPASLADTSSSNACARYLNFGANLEEVPVSVNGHQHGVSRAFRGGRSLIIVFALFALLASAVSGLLVAPTHASTEVAYCSEELNFIWLLNDYRASNGKEPLLLSDTLSLAADRHSSDMGKYSFFSHRTGYNTDMTAALSGVRSDWFVKGSYPWDRMRASGYDYSTSMGENIAAGQQTAQKLFDDFKASKQGHNETMLSSYYKVVGVSQVYVPGSQSGWYWTVDFGGYVDPSVQPAGVYQVSQRVQQNNPKLFYAGTWSGAYSSLASGGSFRYANSARAAVNVTFKGTSLTWLAKKGSNYGKAWVKLDDRAPVVVDLYSSYAKYKQRVYQTGLLADAEHTLTIYWLGQKNAASKGYILSVGCLRPGGRADPGSRSAAPTHHLSEHRLADNLSGQLGHANLEICLGWQPALLKRQRLRGHSAVQRYRGRTPGQEGSQLRQGPHLPGRRLAARAGGLLQREHALRAVGVQSRRSVRGSPYPHSQVSGGEEPSFGLVRSGP